jgi:hypothetical protein
MLTDFTPPNNLSPIVRSTSDKRLAAFSAKSNEIYNKYSPYDGSSNGIGFSQPFVYTKLTDSNTIKNLTKYDSQAFPIGSTVRDLQRVGKFAASGNGILYIGTQYLLQNTNAFNETRIYNPISLIKATAKPGSLGLIDYPIRHLETSGGILNFFLDSLKSTIGMETSGGKQATIDGTATGKNGVLPYSKYAGELGGAKYGMIRFDTGANASSKFSSLWVSGASKGGGGGFLENMGKALIGRLTRLIPSTNPYRFGSDTLKWEYRPEYPTGQAGAYYAFLDDKSGFLTTPHRASAIFYNDKISGAGTAKTTGVDTVKNFHRYYPGRKDPEDTSMIYASTPKITNDAVGDTTSEITGNVVTIQINNLKKLHENMEKTIDSYKNEAPQFRKSAERYTEVKDANGVSYPTYMQIPGKGSSRGTYTDMFGASATIEEANWFAKSRGLKKEPGGYTPEFSIYNTYEDSEDRYNALGVLSGSREEEPRELTQGRFGTNKAKSRDIIFFYFYDLINQIYIPFRATVSSVNEQNSAEWEDINYMGRADKLYLYKGFSRETAFSFTVYANSLQELVPMWKRINYLVGLTRPSKYTEPAINTGDLSENTTGNEGRFIYPPMVTLRLGDMYYDQPCVIFSVSINIPDDANWETYRGEDYSYSASPTKRITIKGEASRQLPMKVDISVSMKLLEKQKSLVTNEHFGFNSPL